jgi:ubiquinone biosynthesis protein UbiJ
LGAGVVEVVGLEVTTVISHHQLIIKFLDTRLNSVVLLEKLSVALLNVLDGAVLSLHLASVLLQMEA